ncbi:hypothetical protein ACFL18_01975 [Patescibacteria group bacterium]
MLTKTDLNQISQVVDKTINKAIQKQVPPIVNKAIQKQVPPIVNKAIQKQVPPIVNKATKPLATRLNKLDKKVDSIIDFFDREYIETNKRLDNIENHIGFPATV